MEETDSKTLAEVIRVFRKREEVGKMRYGTTVDRTDVRTEFWVQMALEEAMDLVLYLTRLKQTINELNK